MERQSKTSVRGYLQWWAARAARDLPRTLRDSGRMDLAEAGAENRAWGLTGQLARSLGLRARPWEGAEGDQSLFTSWRLLVPFHSFWCTPRVCGSPRQSAVVLCVVRGGRGRWGGEAVMLQMSRNTAIFVGFSDPSAWFCSRSRPPDRARRVCSEHGPGSRPAEQRVEAHRDGRQITCHFTLATTATLPNHPEWGELIAVLRTSQKQR